MGCTFSKNPFCRRQEMSSTTSVPNKSSPVSELRPPIINSSNTLKQTEESAHTGHGKTQSGSDRDPSYTVPGIIVGSPVCDQENIVDCKKEHLSIVNSPSTPKAAYDDVSPGSQQKIAGKEDPCQPFVVDKPFSPANGGWASARTPGPAERIIIERINSDSQIRTFPLKDVADGNCVTMPDAKLLWERTNDQKREEGYGVSEAGVLDLDDPEQSSRTEKQDVAKINIAGDPLMLTRSTTGISEAEQHLLQRDSVQSRHKDKEDSNFSLIDKNSIIYRDPWELRETSLKEEDRESRLPNILEKRNRKEDDSTFNSDEIGYSVLNRTPKGKPERKLFGGSLTARKPQYEISVCLKKTSI